MGFGVKSGSRMGWGISVGIIEKYRFSPGNICFSAFFLALLAANTWNHAPWGDELHAWGLVLASLDIATLFDNLHYEGHPGLWHLLLRCAALLSEDAGMLMIVNFAVSAILLAMVVYNRILSPLERMFLLSNYYLVFEYTVLARNYGIAMLLGLIYVRLRTATRQHPIAAFALLGLIANTNIYAFFLAGALALEYAWSVAIAARRPDAIGFRRMVLGATVYGAMVLLAVATVWPASDISYHAQQPALGSPGDFARLRLALLHTAVAPFLPVDFSFPASFAFAGRLYGNGLRVWACILLLPFIGGALWLVFRDRIRFLVVLAGLVLVEAGFAFLVYPSAIRHVGTIFVGFVVLLSIHRSILPDPGATPRPAASLAVLGLLALGTIGGGMALAGQWMRPFSNDRAAALWLTAHASADAVLVGVEDIRTEPIAILLGRRFYALDCRCEDSYVQFRNRRDGFGEATIPERLEEAVRLYRPRPIVLLAGAPLSEATRAAILTRGLMLTESMRLTGAERDSDMTIFGVAER